MPRLFAFVLLIVPVSAMADSPVGFPVSIPSECVVLAQREHVPLVLVNKLEATKAGVKLARMKDSDPLVSQCKQAVTRLELMVHQAQRPSTLMMAR